MSLDVCITQKGLFKKGIPLEVILGNELSYGNFDGLCLECGQLGETEFLAYHPAHIGRGLDVYKRQVLRAASGISMPIHCRRISKSFARLFRITLYLSLIHI